MQHPARPRNDVTSLPTGRMRAADTPHSRHPRVPRTQLLRLRRRRHHPPPHVGRPGCFHPCPVLLPPPPLTPTRLASARAPPPDSPPTTRIARYVGREDTTRHT